MARQPGRAAASSKNFAPMRLWSGLGVGDRTTAVAEVLRPVENRHCQSGDGAYYGLNGKRGIDTMPEVTIVYWRDIPAQVIVGKGRRGSKVQLSERFEKAIDRCAMKVGAKDTDSYLAEWRKAPPYEVEGEPDAVAAAEAARLEAEYDTPRLTALIDAEGRA
jgi:hypothetical protein